MFILVGIRALDLEDSVFGATAQSLLPLLLLLLPIGLVITPGGVPPNYRLISTESWSSNAACAV